ncbi:transposase [Nostoc sp. TCL240-02]|uniref:transposase n=1 Tax=Nostoc sp. TCL240-02 TaxID=2572090 RepID=UPI001C2E046B|nr:transposase [Nostoc sp. TCL240-02]
MPYSSSLTDEEWEILEPLLPTILPAKKQTRPANWTKRELLDGIFYQLKNGCNWEDLPKDLPPTRLYIGITSSGGAKRSDRRIDESFTWTSA